MSNTEKRLYSEENVVPEADMIRSRNAMYIIDRDYHVVSFNSVMKETYPDIWVATTSAPFLSIGRIR